MKKWIHAATDAEHSFEPGDRVTYYNSTVGYANYDAEFVRYETNKYGVQVAVIKSLASEKEKQVPTDYIIPSEKEYFYSLSREDVLSKDFIAKLIHKDDSMFCSKIRYKRVDKDPGMENVTGAEADIISDKEGKQSWRVVLLKYVTKHYSEDRELEADEWGCKLSDPLIDEALSILEKAPEFYVNFAGYQRKF